jgi:hypothetical protein
MHNMKMVDGWYALHNADFSGDVIIGVGEGNGTPQMTIPFEVLKCIVAEHVRAGKISRLEQMTDDEILSGNF